MTFGVRQVLPWAVAGVAGATAVLARSRYERNHFVTEEVTIASRKLAREWTAVFLSDLHDKQFGEENRQLVEEIRQIEPDLILIGGDMMVAKEKLADLTVTRTLMEQLSQIKNCRIFYGNGNHEQRLCREWETYGTMYREFLHILRECGICYLSDRTLHVGEDLAISGLNIDQPYYRDFSPAKMSERYVKYHLGEADPRRFEILLAHSPLFFDAYAQWGADLALCGHFHGGTIRLPYLGGVMTPQFQFFRKCCAGTFEENGHTMVVSRGLGTHSINLRLGNRPQLIVLKLKQQIGE